MSRDVQVIDRHGYINRHECVFADQFSSAKEMPDYPHRYYIRHGDNGNPATLEEGCPTVNFWGTAYFKKPLKFRKYPDMLFIVDWYWQDKKETQP